MGIFSPTCKYYSIFLIFLLVSCHSTKEIIKEVPVETVRTEYQNVYIHDSIYQNDSIFIFMKGDTVFQTNTKYKYIKQQIHDTLIQRDTIPQIVNTETTKIVEKKVPQWWPVYVALILFIITPFLIKLLKSKLKIFN